VGVKGYFLFGQNPGGGGPNAGLHRAGLRNLDWLVVADWFETENAVFWKSDPNGPPPADIKTEVFFLPAAAAPEKEGSLTNTHRVLQWHGKAVDPLGDSRSDAWFIYNLGKRLKALYTDSTDPRDQPLLNLTWDYDFEERPRLPDGLQARLQRIVGDLAVARPIAARLGEDSAVDPAAARGGTVVLQFGEACHQTRPPGLRVDFIQSVTVDLHEYLFEVRFALDPADRRCELRRSARSWASLRGNAALTFA